MVRVPCLAELLMAEMAIACSRLESRAPAGYASVLGAGLRGERCGDVEVACRAYIACGERQR